MIMHEFGQDNKKTFLLLHGAGCTYQMWFTQIKELEKEYHLFVPSISGHEPMDEDFISSKEEAKKLLDWFHDRNYTQIYCICGASLGAHVAAELMQIAPNFAKYAMIESLKAYQYHGFMLKLFSEFGKRMLKKCAKTTGDMAGTYHQKHVSEDTKKTLLTMSEQSLNNIMIESGNYLMDENNQMIGTKTLILYGSKEEKLCRKNTERFANQIVNCKVRVLEGYRHGELSIGNPQRHLELLRELLNENANS